MKKLVGFLLAVIAVLVAAIASGCTVTINNPPVELYELTDAERAELSNVIDGEGV